MQRHRRFPVIRGFMNLVGPLVAAGADIANGNITKIFFFAKFDMFVPNCAVAYCMMSTKEHHKTLD